MFRNLLFVMSLAGTVTFVFYKFLCLVLKKHFSLKWQYYFLKLVMIFFIIPFAEYKYRILDLLHKISPYLWERISEYHLPKVFTEEYIIFISRGQIHFSSETRNMLAVVVISFVISIAIIVRQIISYWKMKQIHSFTRDYPQKQQYQKMFDQIRKELHINRPVRFICSDYYKSPITYGILCPTIIFPIGDSVEIEDDAYELLIRHELVHMKHHDLLIKFIGLLIVAVHWFNPFSYLMFTELTLLCEMYCDDTVMKGRSSDERYRYGKLILELAEENMPQDGEKFLVGMVNNKNWKNYKRRILEMSSGRKQKVVVSILMIMLIGIVGGNVCFAYNPPSSVYNVDRYATEEEFHFTADEFIVNEEYLPYERFFIDDNGNVYNIDDTNGDAKVFCVHDYSIHGVYSVHNKDGKGGCTVEEYASDKCSKCGNVVCNELLNTHTYKYCPH